MGKCRCCKELVYLSNMSVVSESNVSLSDRNLCYNYYAT